MSDDDIEWADQPDTNWDDQTEVAARLVEQFGHALVRLIAWYDDQGRYGELIDGFRDGRISWAVNRHGITVMEIGPRLHVDRRHRAAEPVGDERGLTVRRDRHPAWVRADRDVGGVLGPRLHVDRRD
jgi:hypothetical protein